MTSVSKNVYFDKLDDIVNKYNNTYYITIKMKPVDLKSSTYTDFIKLLESFTKKNCKKQIKRNFELKKE